MKIYEIISENNSTYLAEIAVGEILELDGVKYTVNGKAPGQWYFSGPGGRAISDLVTAKLISTYPEVQGHIHPNILERIKNKYPTMFAPPPNPFASTVRDIGGGSSGAMGDTIRHQGQTWEKIGGTTDQYRNKVTNTTISSQDLHASVKAGAPAVGAPASAPGAPGAPAPGGSRLDKAASVGRKALGPLAKAYLIYDGVKQIRALPVDQMTRREVTAEVTKIIGRMVADAGVWWVGAGIGGALGGTFGGPAGLVTAIAGGFAADALWGDDVKSIVNTTVNFLMGTKDRPAPSSEQPNQTAPTAQTGPNAPPAPYRPGPTQQASDPSLAPQTTPSQTPAPNNGGGGANNSWSTIYNLNKGIIGDNPNLIKPGQVLQIPGKGPYTVQPGDTLSKIAAKP
jgi:hypothetical protein